jgi:hypothetical protein
MTINIKDTILVVKSGKIVERLTSPRFPRGYTWSGYCEEIGGKKQY